MPIHLVPNSYKMENTGYTVDELINAAINNAKEAAKGTDATCCFRYGTYRSILEPTGKSFF